MLKSWLRLGASLIATIALWLQPLASAAQTEIFVANLGSDDVSVFDADSGEVSATIPVGDDPDGLAVHPDGSQVFVANFLSDTVSIIDVETRAVTGSILVGSGPVGVAVTPDGRSILIANRESGTVSIADIAASRVNAVVPVGLGPNGIAVHPGGTFAYVTNSFTRQPGVVSVVDIASGQVVTSIAVNHSPGRVAFAPDGRCAYVTNFRSGNVSVIDTSSHAVIATVPVFGRPSGVAVNPNGAYVYVATFGGRINVLDAVTNELFANIAVGAQPYAVTTAPSGAFGFTADFRSGTSTVLDTLDHVVGVPVVVGQQPFAVAVGCRGSLCDTPPVSPRPTRTPTNTRTATNTRPPTATRTIRTPSTPIPTSTPIPAAVLQIGSGVPDAEGRVSIDVSLVGRSLGGMQNDFHIDTRVMQLISCTINPDTGLFPLGSTNTTCFDDTSIGPCKSFISARYDCSSTPLPLPCPVNPDLTIFRIIIAAVAAPNDNVIPPGRLYTCVFQITNPGALPADLTTAEVYASDPFGESIDMEVSGGRIETGSLPVATAAETSVHADTPTVTAPPTTTVSSAVISIDTANAGDGSHVVASVILTNNQETLGGMQNDIIFDHTVLGLDIGDCVVNPQIGNFPLGRSPEDVTCLDDASIGPCKSMFKALVRCDEESRPFPCPGDTDAPVSVLRTIIYARAAPNPNPIPDGTLYTCTFSVLDPTSLPTVLTNTFVIGSSATGQRLNTIGVDGIVTDAGASSSDAALGSASGSGGGCQLGASQGSAHGSLLPLLAFVGIWLARARRAHRPDESR